MAAETSSLLLVLLTVSSLALPETGGRSDSSIPLVVPNALGTFDWIEDWRSLYDVQIAEEPVSEEHAREGSQATSVVLFSKHNQKYFCSLPRRLAVVEQEEEEEENDPSLRHGVGELLESLKKTCFTKTLGWWTYEYCHGRHIQQYHLEGGRVSGVTVNIGVYQNETDWSQFDGNMAKARKHEGLVHQVYYVNGDKCDLTGKLRQAVAKIHCGLSGNGLERVVEPEACVYLLSVRSTQLCMHPLFQSSAGKTREVIQCSPVLNAKQYEQYMVREREGEKGESLDAEKESTDASRDTISSLSGLFSKVLAGDVMQPSATMGMLLSGSFRTLGEMLTDEDEDDAEEDDDEEEEGEGIEERHKIPKKLKERVKKLKEALAAKDGESEKADNAGETTPSDTPTQKALDWNDDGDTPPTGDDDRWVTEGDSDVQMTEGDSDTRTTEGDSNAWFTEDDTDEHVTEDDDEVQYFDVGGWRVRVSKPRPSRDGEEEREGESDSGEKLRELQERVSEELEEKLATMGINADGRVKVKFVMMGQDEDQEEGEGGENFVDQVIRSLPDDTTSLVTNHLKDVLSGGKVSQREQQKQTQLEDNYNTVWSDADQEGEEEGVSPTA